MEVAKYFGNLNIETLNYINDYFNSLSPYRKKKFIQKRKYIATLSAEKQKVLSDIAVSKMKKGFDELDEILLNFCLKHNDTKFLPEYLLEKYHAQINEKLTV